VAYSVVITERFERGVENELSSLYSHALIKGCLCHYVA